RLWSGWGEEALGGHLAAAMDCLNRRLHEAGQHDDLGVGQSYFLPYSGPKDRKESVRLRITHALLPLLKEYDEMVGASGEMCLPRPSVHSLDELQLAWS